MKENNCVARTHLTKGFKRLPCKNFMEGNKRIKKFICSRIKIISTVKITILPKLSYRFSAMLTSF